MTIAEILVTNKARYTKAFIIEADINDKSPVFRQISDATVDKDEMLLEAKDYFLLDKEGIDEIFGKGDELALTEEDKVLVIGM